MQDRVLYEYTIIRVMPRVERGEFINVGVLLYCKKTNFLGCAFSLNLEKLLCLDAKVEANLIEKQLIGFSQIATGAADCESSISKLEKAARFRWLSASRSTMVQCAPIHPGYTMDPVLEVNKLMENFVS